MFGRSCPNRGRVRLGFVVPPGQLPPAPFRWAVDVRGTASAQIRRKIEEIPRPPPKEPVEDRSSARPLGPLDDELDVDIGISIDLGLGSDSPYQFDADPDDDDIDMSPAV